MNCAAIAASLMVVSISASAFAGKDDRDYMTGEVLPAAKSAEAKWKKSCGCTLAITIDQTTLKSKADMPSARNFCNTLAEEIPKYCVDDASKKAVCQMKTLTIKRADDVAFTFNGGNGVATVYGITAPSWDMVIHVLDK